MCQVHRHQSVVVISFRPELNSFPLLAQHSVLNANDVILSDVFTNSFGQDRKLRQGRFPVVLADEEAFIVCESRVIEK